jgi:putative lipoic acid-binding regulatory protein
MKPVDRTPGPAETIDAPDLLTFPCEFPIKIMGSADPGFAKTIGELVRQHCPDFDPATLVQRPSRAGNYLGLTATIQAISREQLDTLYRALSSHPMVRVVL